ncbi:photosynthetic complex assembly protein PuhC [Jannaschia pohangensis]|uniref:Putative photosynthetic complex assembly protein n=1 Tax=Jannaschia pohangensis TaxID=390807 RepID=A0A1I3UUU5_9RHOB|nr:photosynthetic complex assembly protein PuhC [Jannaschia pohangensis]SFJ85627.1 putative photosynthetic complex assembly protein [Jannaschia pohangensis]
MQSTTSSLANQMKHRDREMVPRFLVVSMFALMAAALALVAFAQATNRPLEGVHAVTPIVQELSVTLEGTRSTGVAVIDEDGRQLAHSTEDKRGFIDVIWVSVMRERTVQRVEGNAPIRITRQESGHIVLIDDSTGWSIALIGYGKDNVAAFADLLS